MLRQEIGDENFFATLRAYYQRFAGGNARTEDFQQVAEEISGSDLDTFFRQWMQTQGNPELSITWATQPNSSGNQVIVQVCLNQDSSTFSLPLEILFKSEAGKSEPASISLDDRQETLQLQVPFIPSEMEADPEQDILAEIKVTKVAAVEQCR
jgi:aminopeptidase N